MFADRYTLDGKPLSTRHSVGMVANHNSRRTRPRCQGPNEKAFVEELWAHARSSRRSALLRRHALPDEHAALQR